MFQRLRVDFIRIIASQALAFAGAWVLVNYVFLGPLPRIQPAFKEHVKEAPQVLVAQAKKTVHAVAEFASMSRSQSPLSDSQARTGSGSHSIGLPAPWVGPNPNDVPTGQSVPPTSTPVPTQLAPTAAPTSPIFGGPQPTKPQQQPTSKPMPTAQPTMTPIPEPTTPVDLGNVESDMIAEINKRRQAVGAPAVRANAQLSQAAAVHSQYMDANHDCTHVESNGSTPEKRVKDARYSGHPLGETVACGYVGAAATVEAWWNSPGHKAILIAANAREIGVSYVNGWSTADTGY